MHGLSSAENWAQIDPDATASEVGEAASIATSEPGHWNQGGIHDPNLLS